MLSIHTYVINMHIRNETGKDFLGGSATSVPLARLVRLAQFLIRTRSRLLVPHPNVIAECRFIMMALELRKLSSDLFAPIAGRYVNVFEQA